MKSKNLVSKQFDLDVAKDVGVDSAIIFQNLVFWINKNTANNKHFYDGRYWTYNSVDAFKKLFTWLSTQNIRTCIKKLESKGYIVKGNYNKSAYDKTTWYSIGENYHFYLLELTDREVGTNEPIPYINTDNKTHISLQTQKSKPYTTISYLIALPPEDVATFTKEFNCNPKQVENKGKELYSYCKAKGKKYKDYKHFLANALRKDFGVRKTYDELVREENPGIVLI